MNVSADGLQKILARSLSDHDASGVSSLRSPAEPSQVDLVPVSTHPFTDPPSPKKSVMLTVVSIVAIACAGLMAGLLFGDWLGPAFARSRMPLTAFVQFQQVIHVNYLRVLPALSSVALFGSFLWLFLLRREVGGGAFAVLTAAVISIAVGFTITFLYNVPVNRHLESWDHSAPPADAREIWRRWESAHVVRTVFWVVGFVLEVVALAM